MLGRALGPNPGLAVDLYSISTRHQGISGWHQGVGTRCQPRHPGADGDLLANHRVDCTALWRHRGIARLHARHNRINRVSAQPRQHKTAVGAELHQRVIACIGRAAASGNKPGAEQLTATGQVHRGPRQYSHRLSAEDHPDLQVPVLIHNPAQAKERYSFAIVGVGLAINRTAVRQHQALATGRGQAAGQQLHSLGTQRANFDQPQRCAHDPALLDDGAAQLQTTEG